MKALDSNFRDRETETFRRMSPEQKLRLVFELSDRTQELLRAGLRAAFPELSEAELQKLYLDRMSRCHNENY